MCVLKRYLTQMAAARLGAVLVNINPAYQPQELLYCLNKVDPIITKYFMELCV